MSLSIALLSGLLLSRLAKKAKLPAVTAHLFSGVLIVPFLTKTALTKAGDIQEEGRTSAREQHLAKKAQKYS